MDTLGRDKAKTGGYAACIASGANLVPYGSHPDDLDEAFLVRGDIVERRNFDTRLFLAGGAVNEADLFAGLRNDNAHMPRPALFGIGAGEYDHIAGFAIAFAYRCAECAVVDRGARHMDMKMMEDIIHETRAIKAFGRIAISVAIIGAELFLRESDQAVLIHTIGVVLHGLWLCGMVPFFLSSSGGAKQQKENEYACDACHGRLQRKQINGKDGSDTDADYCYIIYLFQLAAPVFKGGIEDVCLLGQRFFGVR
jgi:hypothetical protein